MGVRFVVASEMVRPISRLTVVALWQFQSPFGCILYISNVYAQCVCVAWQVDWESILCPSADIFIQSVSSWMYPHLKQTGLAGRLPQVTDVISTLGQAIVVLATSHS